MPAPNSKQCKTNCTSLYVSEGDDLGEVISNARDIKNKGGQEVFVFVDKFRICIKEIISISAEGLPQQTLLNKANEIQSLIGGKVKCVIGNMKVIFTGENWGKIYDK